MVLGDLGAKLTATLQKLQRTTVVDDEMLESILKDISRALLESDVNIRIVGELRKNIKTRVNMEAEVAGTNRQKLIRRAIIDELVRMVSGRTPYRLKKGKPNVVMFVGLQVRTVAAAKTNTASSHYRRKLARASAALPPLHHVSNRATSAPPHDDEQTSHSNWSERGLFRPPEDNRLRGER